MAGPTEHKFLVVDGTGEIAPLLAREAPDADETPRISFAFEETAGEANAEELDERVRREEIRGWIFVPPEFAADGTVEHHAATLSDPEVLHRVERRFQRALAVHKAAGRGMSRAEIESLLEPVRSRTFLIGNTGGREADFTAVYLRAVAVVMMLLFALLPTSQILMRSVIEEKSNRVIEVLLSSVSPLELMLGKILGLGAVGLTMIGTWAACAGLLSLRMGTLPLDPGTAGLFVLFFLPGYFLFAGVLGAIGSVCNSERETQPFLSPISLMLVLPVMLGVFIAEDPGHILVRVLSFFPPLTPGMILFRHSIRPLPAAEIAAAWTVLVAAAAGMFFVAARVFRVGILMYGKRPSLPEALRWARER